ncbi:MAG: hypothetical protein IKX33_10805 [Prevotella sp.]|nr:hypothetical protein [Prevotella sp.]
MKITYKKPNIYKESMGSECMAPVVLSNQSIGGNVNPIGGEGKVDDEADANIYRPSLWDEE